MLQSFPSDQMVPAGIREWATLFTWEILLVKAMHIKITYGCFVPGLVEIGRVILRKMTFKCWLLILLLSLLEKGEVFHLSKLEFPSPKDAYAKISWNWLSCSREEVKIVKNLCCQQTNFDQKSSLEPSTQVS